MSVALFVTLAAIAGAAAGWVAVSLAARVLDDRDEDLGPMPRWAWHVTSATTAVLFGLITAVFEDSWLLFPYLIFVFVTMALIVTDIHSRLIPDRISFRGTAIAAGVLAVAAVLDGSTSNLTRAAIGAVIYLGMALLLWLPGGGKNFGGGDVKLSPILGLFTAFLGWDVFIVAVFLGFLAGGLAGLVLVITRAKGLRDHFAFGPPLTLGAYIAIIRGVELLDWYAG
jgi:leader peptidase (prepilin peptidase)/N-methyltransferase